MTAESGIEAEAGFLASTDIRAEMGKGGSAEIQISRSGQAIAPDDNRITDVGFDLTSSSFLKVRRLRTGSYIEVRPRHAVLVETAEDMRLGRRVGALVASKVRMVSQGFSRISTTIDLLGRGKLLLSFRNNSATFLRINIGTPIATLVFFRSLSPVAGKADVNDEHNRSGQAHRENLLISNTGERCPVNRQHCFSVLLGEASM
jgi:deoxycytidine triphosphate deaminase